MTSIAIDIRMLTASGIGTYLQNLIPKIIEMNCAWQFTLMGSAEEIRKYPWAKQPHVEIVNCCVPIYSISEQIALTKKIPKNIDLFWSPHYNIPLLYKGKLLVTIHDVIHLARTDFSPGFHKWAYAKFMFNAVRQKADAILCVSDFTKNEFSRLIGVPKQIIETTHLGVASEWFAKSDCCNPHSKPYILYVGNIKPNKNLVGLLKAFEKIADNIPHDVVIVGKKDGFITGDDAVFDITQQLAGRVTFTGQIPNSMLQKFYACADILVLPSFYEGFGLTPLEAMASGCPVLVSDAASLPEVCGDADLYVNPYDIEDIANKIVTLLSDERLRNVLKENGLLRCNSFSWDKTAVKTVEVIRKVLAT